MVVSKELIDVLECPTCKGDLKDKDDFLECICGQKYPVKEGIPVFL